ncbi:major facilitator superfamily domain-containing protein [Mycena olivaceomarginata]|nr:major facilitator superfamily domain-containing protein [Mycena olivaceomarginata]
MQASPSKGGHIVSELVAADLQPWYKKPNLRSLYMVLLPACVGAEMTSAFDVNLMDVLQATSSWKKFYHPSPSLLGLITAIYSLGAIFSLPLVPIVIVLGCALMVFGALLQGTAQNAHMFIAARFILGFGVPFSIVGSASLIAELSYPKERAVMTSLFNGFFGIGSIIIASISLRTYSMHSNWGWRIPSFLQATPSLIQLIFVLLIPDSPRWLLAKGRGAEAAAILIKYHAEGDAHSELVKVEYAEIEKKLREEMKAARRGWLELFATPGMRKRAMLAVFSWPRHSVVWGSYLPRILASIGIHDNMTKNRLNLALSCWGLLCAVTLALITPRFKRRPMFLACTVSILVVLVGWTAATAQFAKTQNHAWALTVLAFIFLFSPAYGLGYSVLTYTYLMELFPFHLRAKGIVLFSWFGRTSIFFNQLVNPIGLHNAGWKYYISYCVCVAFQVVFIYFMFPETAHLTLEELAFLYEDNKPGAEDSESEEKATSPTEEIGIVELV